MEPLSNENQTSSLQRIVIGVGTLIVVILTVIAAIFLAMQQTPDDATPIVQATSSPTTQVTLSPPTLPSLTPTPIPSPDAPTATSVPPVQTTEIPPTDIPTPVASPTTANTPTPVVIVVTPTPLPATTPPSETDTCPSPPNWVAYTIQAGDTLNTLATRTNIGVFDLQQANCLASSTVQPGQIIHLPFTPPPPSDTPTPTSTSANLPTPSRTPTAVAPIINNVVPDNVDEATNQEEVIITVIGRNFRSRESGFKVELRGPQSLELQLSEARSDTSFDAIVPPNLLLGTYDIVVTNPNNRAGIRESAFIIGQAPTPTPGTPEPKPEIEEVTNTLENERTILRLTITGNSFKPKESGFEVVLQHPNTGLEVSLQVDEDKPATENSFEATVLISEFTENGDYNLKIVNPDGQPAIKSRVYTHPP